jgi:hypothetical protein
MRRRGLEDEPMTLLDDEGHVETRTVELRPTFRREWLLVVAAIAVVVAVGLFSDSGPSAPDEAATPATTTSAVPTTVHRRFSATVRRFHVTTTSTAPRPDGPVAPFTTGTAIVGMDGRGRVSIYDLDTGLSCVVAQSTTTGVYLNQSAATSLARAVVQTGDGVGLVDASCALEQAVTRPGSYPIAVGDEYFWTSGQSGEGGGPLVQHDLSTGLETGLSIDAPAYIGPSVSSGDRLVVGVGGQVTEIRRRAVRDIGPGNPIALNGSLLALVRCQELRCRLHLTDLDTNDSRVVTPIWLTVIPWSTGVFSPDGSLLLVNAQQPGEQTARVVLVDVATGQVHILGKEYNQAVFTVDGTHLIATSVTGAVLMTLDGAQTWPIHNITQAQGGLVAIPTHVDD